MTVRPSERSALRCVPVRLCDLPLSVRVTAAHLVKLTAKDEGEREEIFLAAVCPSDQTYWVTEDARPLLDYWLAAA